jgi:hypothetical protein
MRHLLAGEPVGLHGTFTAQAGFLRWIPPVATVVSWLDVSFARHYTYRGISLPPDAGSGLEDREASSWRA